MSGDAGDPTRVALRLAPMTAALAAEVALWRYASPDDVHDGTPGTPMALLDGNHVAIMAGDEFVGFVGIGGEARVRGGPHDDGDVTDVAIGIRPDRLGEGIGTRAGLLAIETLRFDGHRRLRVCILDDNDRSVALALRLGFHEAGSFERESDATRFRQFELEVDV